jgi:hypothetical protein
MCQAALGPAFIKLIAQQESSSYILGLICMEALPSAGWRVITMLAMQLLHNPPKRLATPKNQVLLDWEVWAATWLAS